MIVITLQPSLVYMIQKLMRPNDDFFFTFPQKREPVISCLTRLFNRERGE